MSRLVDVIDAGVYGDQGKAIRDDRCSKIFRDARRERNFARNIDNQIVTITLS